MISILHRRLRRHLHPLAKRRKVLGPRKVHCNLHRPCHIQQLLLWHQCCRCCLESHTQAPSHSRQHQHHNHQHQRHNHQHHRRNHQHHRRSHQHHHRSWCSFAAVGFSFWV